MTYFLDLFAGIGGFALGACWAGLRFDRHFFSEVDDYAIRVYQQRFPDAEPLGDIRAIRGADLPMGDWIIAGGFPCQDISVAGKGAGLAGERSGLWYEYARLVGELRPRYAIMENVGALAFRGLDSVLGSLTALGYDAEWQDIRASDVGAPHRRERIWIVGYPSSGGRGRLARRRAGEESQNGHLQLETGAMADSSGWQSGESKAGDGREGSIGGGEKIPNATSERLEKQGLQQGYNSREYAIRNRKTEGRGDWGAAEPDVGRVAHGVPARVDRLKCLGNSIVPQIAEMIFAQEAFDEWRGQ